MKRKLEGKVIWVTGASSGIGKAIVYKLALNKDIRLILSARNQKALQEVKEGLPLPIDQIMTLQLDLENSQSFQQKAEEVIKKFGKIDLLIHAGGVGQRASFTKISSDTFRKIMEINFFGTVMLTKVVLPFLLQEKGGDIIVISSVQGKFGIPERTAYAASKHALHGFFDSLRAEHHKDGIDIMLVCPGYVDSAFSSNALLGQGNPIHIKEKRKAISPEECADLTVKGYLKGKNEIYPGRLQQRVAVWLKRFFPNLLDKIVRTKV
ncbi:SDR family oxidoreductase [Limibacter armeniacum]|uniref:SDR family oxidoreductase n=1 Tax=Limibacter armeniacum TaxID=466084 RepID=UPI002FE53F1E